MSAMDFFSQTYIAIRGPTGAPQSPLETIAKLADRLGPSTLLSDRRASILALKGLAKDHRLRSAVGDHALRGLLDVLENDAEVDPDIALPVVETLNLLCDPEDDPLMKTLGQKYMDVILENDRAVHKLIVLASQQAFTPRTATLKLLGVLLKHRRAKTQQYFLTLPTGPAIALAMLDDPREMMRNESLGFWELLITKNQDIQKLLAFQGAFEKLFNIIESEGGIESRVNAESALTCVDTLLRFNSANQNYFRESAFPAVLLSLLQFPPDLPPQEPAPQQFALQFWDGLKEVNTSLVVGMVGLLVSSKAGKTQTTWTATRCLMELALASNAPAQVKTKALSLLPEDFDLPLTQMIITPYIPVPDTNGEEWDRLESSSAFDVLVELILHAEYNGTIAPPRRRDSLELRASALRVFCNFVNNDEMKEMIVQSMLPRDGHSPITPLLHCLIIPNNPPLDISAIASTQFASLIFTHLIRRTPRAKAAALQIVPPSGGVPTSGEGKFFVPADDSGGAPPPPPEDEDDPLPLMQILTEHLSLAFISRPKMQVGDSPTRETREWDRIIINYICLLVQWLWDDPKSVRTYLEAGGLTLLVEPIGQPIEASDGLIPSLCAFLLGTCYEFNREPGEITRATIHQVITRLGVDTLTDKIGSAKEDVRFREIEPESFVLGYPTPKEASVDAEIDGEAEAWFDWAFLDFWKSNYYTVQRAVAVDPNSSVTATSGASSGQGADQETQMLLTSLREVISNQAREVQMLQKSVKDLTTSNKTKDDEITSLKAQIELLRDQVTEGEEKRKESEKEQEDLLVLLDELSSKRRRDKEKMRDAGLEVSEDEDEDEDDE